MNNVNAYKMLYYFMYKTIYTISSIKKGYTTIFFDNRICATMRFIRCWQMHIYTRSFNRHENGIQLFLMGV